MNFYLNPVAYIAGLGPERIDQIILVPGNNGEGPPGFGPDSVPPDDEGDRRWELYPKTENPQRDDVPEDIESMQSSGKDYGVAVEVLVAGTSISVSGFWEFVPYNDIELRKKVNLKFRRAVEARRHDLLEADSKKDRLKALREIKDVYDRTFGKRGKPRNLISLFLYGGPLGSPSIDFWASSVEMSSTLQATMPKFEREVFYWGSQSGSTGKPSVLYSGDAYLETHKRYERLSKFMGSDQRMSRLNIFQVMHHGARGNWHPGIAKKICPAVSVFSSNPKHRSLRHPHSEVLRDFWPYCPVQVDQSHRALMQVRVSF